MKILIVCQDAIRALEIKGAIKDEVEKREFFRLRFDDEDVYFDEVGSFEQESVSLLVEKFSENYKILSLKNRLVDTLRFSQPQIRVAKILT